MNKNVQNKILHIMKHYNISVDDMMSMLSDVEDSKPKKANKKTEKKTEKKETETETDKKD